LPGVQSEKGQHHDTIFLGAALRKCARKETKSEHAMLSNQRVELAANAEREVCNELPTFFTTL